jgi:hypothetical protein
MDTLGYDLSYIGLTPTDTGRKIRFVTNRLLRFGEVYNNNQSIACNLTPGEIEINDKDKSKSTGVLYPAAQLVINKEGQLQIGLRKNPGSSSTLSTGTQPAPLSSSLEIAVHMQRAAYFRVELSQSCI